MRIPYKAPKLNMTGFNCPHCQAFADQKWIFVNHFVGPKDAATIRLALCEHCKKFSIWRNSALVDPVSISAPLPHADMPVDILNDFMEARGVFASSPRSSAALLRLCVQKLCVELGESGKNINKDIGGLVTKGLSPQIQQALDIVRVVGNEQVHPGQLDVRDDPDIVGMLFTLVNLIVDDRISKPKAIAEMYAKLPTDKLKGIEDRDKPKS